MTCLKYIQNVTISLSKGMMVGGGGGDGLAYNTMKNVGRG